MNRCNSHNEPSSSANYDYRLPIVFF